MKLIGSSAADFKPFHLMRQLSLVRENKSRCSLCQLLLKCLSKDPEFETLPSQSAWVHVDSRPFGKVTIHDRVQGRDGLLERHGVRLIVQLTIAGKTWSSDRAGTSFAYGLQLMRPVADAATTAGSVIQKNDATNLLFGRAVGALIDHELLRSWLLCCEGNHSNCSPTVTTIRAKCFRVIDIDRLCVTEQRFGTCRYAALSYVWGGVEQVQLLSKTSAWLKKEGAIIGQQFPRTILDAISVCQIMGLHYLWIDALCILQDDESDRTD